MPNLRKALIFFLVSAGATLWPLLLARWLWPEGLYPGALFIFWPASGVNLALALIFGRRYLPLILLNAVLAMVLLGEPIGYSLVGALGNMVEAFLAYWLIVRFGKFHRPDRVLGSVRGVTALALCSLIAPLATSSALALAGILSGTYPAEAFFPVFISTAVSNACGMVILAPVVLAVSSGFKFTGKPLHLLGFGIAVALAGWFGFGALFLNQPNAVFLVFAILVFAALRFGWREVALLNLLTLVMIYAAMISNADLLPRSETSRVLWFVQGFGWVLATTSLMIAAQVAERNRAETRLLAERNTVLELRLREERARLNSLRHQVNPHFLFNALNWIYAALPGSDSGPYAPRKMITHLAGYLRTTLDDSSADLLPLSQEIENAGRYLAIERECVGEALQVEVKVAPGLENFPVPVFVLQLLVENAIRHGLEARPGAFLLEISAELDEEQRLLLEVSNTGEWVEPRPVPGHGNGLKNIRRRLGLLYGETASLERIPETDRVRMRLTLPAKTRHPEGHPA